jgi:hypothetical protein
MEHHDERGHHHNQDIQMNMRLPETELDAYISAHMEKFEEAKRKWADCSLEEWKDGANGICSVVVEKFLLLIRPVEIHAMFGAVLDSVKSHFMSKMTLYTSLSDKCNDRMGLIDERNAELDKMRKDMGNGAGGLVGVKLE